ncbi:hypothetical protein CPB85DRAFT_163601 [Mucidula mucida]|nr:hypothetical protein CPB85DRAFT_163601 [Mucidula mucida]
MVSVSDSATQKLKAPARRALHRMLSWNDSQPWPRRIRRKPQASPTGESTTGPSAEEALITSLLIPSNSSTFASMSPSSNAASSSSITQPPLSRLAQPPPPMEPPAPLLPRRAPHPLLSRPSNLRSHRRQAHFHSACHLQIHSLSHQRLTPGRHPQLHGHP